MIDFAPPSLPALMGKRWARFSATATQEMIQAGKRKSGSSRLYFFADGNLVLRETGPIAPVCAFRNARFGEAEE